MQPRQLAVCQQRVWICCCSVLTHYLKESYSDHAAQAAGSLPAEGMDPLMQRPLLQHGGLVCTLHGHVLSFFS